MPVSYHIYKNDGDGGPVDYATPVATTPSTSFAVGPLPVPSDTTFGVRAFDPATGAEEMNTDAVVRIRLDAGGQPVAPPPNPVHALCVFPQAGGELRVAWAYHPAQGVPAATSFEVSASPGIATRTVAASPGRLGYQAILDGLADPHSYAISVRPFAGPASGPAVTTTLDYSVSPLAHVEDLSAAPL